MIAVGAVKSNVIPPESIPVSGELAPVFPAVSSYVMDIAALPVSVTPPSASAVVYVALHDVEPPETEAVSPAIVTTGVAAASFVVNVKVRTSPSAALDVSAASDTRFVSVIAVGAVKSNVIPPESSVVSGDVVPAFPTRS